MAEKKIDKSKYFDIISTKGRPYFLLHEQGKLAIEKLASYMCTDEEIASLLGVSVDVLTNAKNNATFAECKKRGFEQGKASLRRKQYEIAMSGNCTMLVWLGKQYLGQTDKSSLSLDAEEESKKLMKDFMETIKYEN